MFDYKGGTLRVVQGVIIGGKAVENDETDMEHGDTKNTELFILYMKSSVPVYCFVYESYFISVYLISSLSLYFRFSPAIPQMKV